MADIYSEEGIESMRDDDSIDDHEEGFMQGYLQGDGYV